MQNYKLLRNNHEFFSISIIGASIILKLYFCPSKTEIMETTRQKKVGRLIQKELSLIFQKEAQTLFEGRMISVTIVHITADLSLARVYLSIFPSTDLKSFFPKIQEKGKTIRHELSRKIRFQIKSIPELSFFIDDSFDYAENIENLLKK